MTHTGSDGSNARQRLDRVGYAWRAYGENVAWNQQTPAAVMNAWMNSSGHRANILNCAFTEIGVGVAAATGRTGRRTSAPRADRGRDRARALRPGEVAGRVVTGGHPGRPGDRQGGGRRPRPGSCRCGSGCRRHGVDPARRAGRAGAAVAVALPLLDPGCTPAGRPRCRPAHPPPGRPGRPGTGGGSGSSPGRSTPPSRRMSSCSTRSG